MAVETFIIEIQQRGAQQTQAALRGLHDEAKRGADIMAFFRQALVAFSFARAATNALEFVDSVTRINNRLRIATSSAEEYARAQEFIYRMSNQTRTEVEANAVSYARLIQSTKVLQLSTEQLETVMTALANAQIIGGATSMEARNALIQFSQSLASGALRGDELNSVVEQLPALANAIGRQFGLADGQLRNFIKNNPGLVDTSKVVQAVLQESQNLAAQAAKSQPTIAQGFIVIGNSVKYMLNEVNNGTDAFGIMARALIWVGQNLGTVVTVIGTMIALKVAVVVGGWASSFIQANNVLIRLVGQMRLATAAQTAFNAVMLANPVGAIAAAIVAFVVALVSLYNSFESVRTAVNGAFGVMSELVGIVWQMVSAIGEALFGWIPFNDAANKTGEIVGFLIRVFVTLAAVGIAPAVTAMGIFVDVLSRIGLVSKETAAGIWESVKSYQTLTASLLVSGTTAEQAAKGQQMLGQTADAGKILFEGLGGATDKVSEKMQSHAAKVRDTSNAYFGFEQRMITTGINQTRVIASFDGMSASTDRAANGVNRVSQAIQMSVPGFDNVTARTAEWADYNSETAQKLSQVEKKTQDVTTSGVQLQQTLEKSSAAAASAGASAEGLATSLSTAAESAMRSAEGVNSTAKGLTEANPLMEDAQTAGNNAANGFSALAGSVSAATEAIWDMIAAYQRLAEAKSQAGEGGSTPSFGGGRAIGGPVKAGTTYLVGEKGPELFTPPVSGNIVPNSDLNAMSRSGSNQLSAISKAMTRAAAAMSSLAPAVVEVATGTKQVAEAVDYQNSSYRFDKFAAKTQDQYEGMTYGSPQYGMNMIVPGGYASPDNYGRWMEENKILPGDDAYQQNVKTVTNRGINYFEQYRYDANSPFSKEINEANSKLQMLQASLERYGIDAFAYSGIDIMGQIKAAEEAVAQYVSLQEQAIEKLKEYREAGSAYEQFKAMLPGIAASPTGVSDFQTLTPFQGGEQRTYSDPYGIANKAAEANRNGPAANDNSTTIESQDNSINVQMTVVANDAQSFRNNKAQLEDQLLGMVSRAKRRRNS